MVLARKGRTAHSKQQLVSEVSEMAQDCMSVAEVAGGGSAEPGIPRAVFVPHANSLPFEERCISLEQPVKIGRNVYRSTPAPTNTIFECRVLSRHHATLWYEKGHFYIMDNQSSNGTFINNNRCAISKENEPHEVFSGDVLQFGIAVVENQPNQEKNTFLPVVALLKLFHADGKEAKMTSNLTLTSPLHLKDLYQLNNIIQEATHREASLESRLRLLRDCVERTRAEALSGWELLVGEQRLLARVRALEATVAAGKPLADRQHAELLQDKHNYQEAAQESLRQAHEVRLALEEEVERKRRAALTLHEINCNLKAVSNHALAELQKLAARCERKICAARIAMTSAEEREAATRAKLPLALSKVSGEWHMLVVSPERPERRDEPAALADAVRALPDCIKLLLPDIILSQVGLKAISIDAKNAEECELILNRNENSDVESKEKRTSLEESVLGWLEDNCNKKDNPQHAEKETNGLPNHDSPELNATVLEAELNCKEHEPDNNANSTFRPQANHKDEPKKLISEAVWAGVVRALRDEVCGLRGQLAELATDNQQLREVRDQLLSLKLEVEMQLSELVTQKQMAQTSENELESTMTIRMPPRSEAELDSEKHDPESHKELVARLERALAAERQLTEQLATRPSPDRLSELTLTCEKLRRELKDRDRLLDELGSAPYASSSVVTIMPDDQAAATEDSMDMDELSALNELDEALGEFGGDDSLDEETSESEEQSASPRADEDADEEIERKQAMDGCGDTVEEKLIDSADINEEDKPDSNDACEAEIETTAKEQETIATVEEKDVREEKDAREEKEVREEKDAPEEKFAPEEKDAQEKQAQEESSYKEIEAGEAIAELGSTKTYSVSAEEVLALQEELVRVKEGWAAARAEAARARAGRAEPRLQLVTYGVALLACLLYTLLYRYVS